MEVNIKKKQVRGGKIFVDVWKDENEADQRASIS